tara:strand:+ start:1807 stop:1992 length:186 start_codon:yes stop_codon:yes gene_type:complete
MSESAFYNINMNGTREPGESREDYKDRMKELKWRTKLHKKGRIAWDGHNGTYIKAIHGPLK